MGGWSKKMGLMRVWVVKSAFSGKSKIVWRVSFFFYFVAAASDGIKKVARVSFSKMHYRLNNYFRCLSARKHDKKGRNQPHF